MRPHLVLAVSALAAAPLHAQRPAAPAIPVGTPLRAATATGEVTGTLVALVGDTLVMQTRTAHSLLGVDPTDVFEQVRLPRDSVVRLFAQSGHEPRLQSAARDGLWGALFGAGFTSATFVLFGGANRGAFSDPRGRRDLLRGAVLLSGIGAAYGHAHPRPRWREVARDGAAGARPG